jgi:glycosyltransferase involved in cell wall biosynthesis
VAILYFSWRPVPTVHRVLNAMAPARHPRALPFGPFGYNLRSALRPGREVDAWLAAVRPDVLHVHHPFVLSTTALLAARKARIPVVATNHTVPECSLWGVRDHRLLYSIGNRAFSAWLKWVLERCDMVTTPPTPRLDL